MSVSDALTLMLMFGSFLIGLLEYIDNHNKK
ncbi:hypothetical protein JOC36_001517 [Weissella uvarum]|nr:hypothetical protein [Weissella uvarum]MCM0596080.1 putative holin-like toxin [Weissella uvarum]